MIVSISLAKVGQRQTPSQQSPSRLLRQGLCALVYLIDKEETTDGSGLCPVLESALAGLPALQGGEPGQVRNEAATAIYCKCRGLGSPLSFSMIGVERMSYQVLARKWRP